jgi:hypothetical protein
MLEAPLRGDHEDISRYTWVARYMRKSFVRRHEETADN